MLAYVLAIKKKNKIWTHVILFIMINKEKKLANVLHCL
jgi:hypothetical protein